MSESFAPPKGDLGDIPYLRPGVPRGAAAFRRRAERLAALAPGHAAGDFLALVGRLAAAQAVAAAGLRVPPPSPSAAGHPLDASRPPEGWRDVLATLARALAGVPMPAEARDAVASVSRRGPAELDALAGRVLAGELAAADLSAAPFVGAALQVVLGAQADLLAPEDVPRAGDAACPACGAAPVVGLVLAGDKLRYLVCGMCATHWHVTRLQCILCRSGARVSYLSVDAGGAEAAAGAAGGPARAEACAACEAYTKLLYVEQAPELEPFADDLASIALDLLVAERGLLRIGRNPYLATAPG
jgi:FdhE protein